MRRASDNNGHRSPLVDADQCGAICVRSTSLVNSEMEALLITSRETGRWVIPKGWSEGRKKLHRVAREEAWEEAGVRGRVCKNPYGHYRYDKKVSHDEFIPCLVQVHLLTVSTLKDDFPEKGQRQIRWFSPEEASGLVIEPELKQLLFKLRQQ
ncbi:NUDIX hydrolase (plasmid) [Agrobacterium pusense]|uniref:DNA mismatch repair protein MutT n=7 Tax=Rhizobium/Agrobacterium group TaxID=227290 RepID=A0A2Z2PXG8_9HYPH|nr:NUDIX hydrolase [Agrobacterium radiobacter]ASK43148.1 DNA mismatch repair protein MutT [Agrobacterium deltaense]ASK46661.1 DNA mismatch repair protein MutT [Rhizobium rhizogenes]ASK47397.1 DNA mismatch repair protein MutT [Agrobacterium tomkonis]ASK47517.1 DNA mismatch repair protein MutT [Agrobacterium fabrum]AYM14903.1 hypothetical protein At1D1108_52770 [Agrobacterium tumefaciens]KAA6481456.1 NUDIX domain-containing protein [Agrobacterium sp. ICMP 7243]MBN7807906.1 NUDIX hydrolase [Agr